MTLLLSQLISAIDLLEEGAFENALSISDEVIQTNAKNFWGWYLGAIALGYLQNHSSFAFYLQKASEILPDSSYIKYLKVYQCMIEDRQPDAVVELASLVDSPNGWFARKLLERIRLKKGVQRAIDKGDIGFFIILPDIRRELTLLYNNKQPEESTSQKKKSVFSMVFKVFGFFKFLFTKKRASLIFILLVFSILFSVFFLSHNYHWAYLLQYFSEASSDFEEWEKLEMSPETRVLPNVSPRQALYNYTNTKEIIDHFEEAKSLLKKKKVNQSRYNLQKILHSNADFQAKEKCKIFLSFIPDLAIEEFDDPVSPAQILKEPEYYQYAQVLWEGQIHSNKVKANGRQLEVLVRHQDINYIVHAFMQLEEFEQNKKPYHTFKNVKNTQGQPTDAVLFGKFKSLIGSPKKIYIELEKVWL